MAELLLAKEAAAMLRVSVATLNTLRKEGKVPFVKLGRRVMFRKEALEDLINRSTVTLEK